MAKVTKTSGRMLTLREPAQQIWLAGLGAFAMAEEEGSKLFSNLVKKGKTLEKANLARLEKVRTRVDELRAMPADTMSRLGGGFDTGVEAVLDRLGVPTKKEIGALTRRVEALTKALEKRHTPARVPRTTTRTRKAVVRTTTQQAPMA